MGRILDSYHEVGIVWPLLNRAKRIGFHPRYWIYRLNWWAVNKFHYITPFPIHVDIESTNHCNLKCTMCPHSLDDFKMEKGYFDMGIYRHLVAEFKEKRLNSLKLNIRGEPLLNKNLVEMVSLAKSAGVIEVMFNTNGLLLSPQKTHDLVAAGLDYLIVSVDGATSETYNRIRKGGEYRLLVDNLEYFIGYRKEKRRKKPLLRLQFVEMDENRHEIPQYLEKWTGKADVLTVNRYSNRGCGEQKIMDMVPVRRVNCYHPWRRISINWQGQVMMCCGDWENRCIMGDVRTQNIFDIWHSKKFNNYRKLLCEARLHEIPCCKECFVLASYIWEKNSESKVKSS